MLHHIWHDIFLPHIALCVAYVYSGAAVFSGLAVMIVLLVVNGFIATKLRKLQIEQMRNKDKRVKTISEILSGIKVWCFFFLFA